MGNIGRFVLFILAFSFGVLLLPITGAKQPVLDDRVVVPNPGATRSDSIRTDLQDYIWPTEKGKAITSTFGEFRRTHFHGGIDIGTGNQTGYRVYAARNGYVSRIRVNATGYGKMLYVRHPDGYYTMYAHLKKFNAEIDARVEREQLNLERYPVDIECPPTEFPVAKGDIIAYTGETGTGTPHLHFEIRDENFEPINPFLCPALIANDNIPPAIKKIAVRPLGEQSLVNASSRPQTFNLKMVKNGVYKLTTPIHMTGEVGFAIEARDRSNGSSFRHGVHRNELFIDEKLIYTVQLDRVPAAMAHEIALYYDWDLLSSRLGRFEKLYMDSPNDLPFYTPKGNTSGIVNTVDFADGLHEFKIVSSDFNGQSATVTGTVFLNHPPNFYIEADDTNLRLRFADIGNVQKIKMYTKRNGSENWNLKTITPDPSNAEEGVLIPILRGKYDVVKFVAENSWGTQSSPRIFFLNKPNIPGGSLHFQHHIRRGYVQMTLTSNRMFTATPSVIIYEGTSRRTVPLVAISERSYAGSFHPLESHQGLRRLVAEAEVDGNIVTAHNEFELYPIVPLTSGNISFDDGNLVISSDSASVFQTVLLQIETSPFDGGSSYTLLPENAVLNKGLSVGVKARSSKERQGLFFRGRGGWDLLATSQNISDGMFRAEITGMLGELSILTDETPPSVTRVRISRTSGGRPTISFGISDNLSGVEYNELKMYIDGGFVIPELDGEHRRASYQVTNQLKRGPHHLTIHVRDKMGNSREVVQRFIIP